MRIGEIAVPTRYFKEASSVNFRRSVVYGLSTLRVIAALHAAPAARAALEQARQPEDDRAVRRLTTGLARSGIGILISVVCVVPGPARRGPRPDGADCSAAPDPAWLVLAVAGVTADLAFRALRWQSLIAPIQPVPLRRLSAYMLVGYLANNVLPARLGELVRSHYLGDREGISRSATLGTVVVERVVDTVVLVGIGAAAILVLNVRGVVVSAILVGVALAGLLCVALAVALAAHRLPGRGAGRRIPGPLAAGRGRRHATARRSARGRPAQDRSPRRRS